MASPLQLYIYYIQEGSQGPIKIGYADHPESRLALLQTGNPRQLRLLGTWRVFDAGDVEAELHYLLSPWRIRGEWFKPSREVLEAISARMDPPRTQPAPVRRSRQPRLRERVRALRDEIAAGGQAVVDREAELFARESAVRSVTQLSDRSSA